MSAAVGSSHTTVSKVFSAPSLPGWGTLELLVESLGGDVPTFHELWLRASSPTESPAPHPTNRIAGRRAELSAVRGHLEKGSGLMVVAGEAGMGKTKLVMVAARTSRALVTTGHCLPLSSQTPLMPVAEALRTIHDADDGRLLKEALAVAPPYVRESLARLLPEVAREGSSTDVDDEFSRPRLFGALSMCLSQLHALSGLGLVLEDLHWADTATLDLLEHLIVRDVGVPVVATFRLEDPETGDEQRDWWLRVRRLADVTTLGLTPLTRQEADEQCRLLGLDLDEATLDRIHVRSGGQPFFTEQLAVHAHDHVVLPEVLADLLDRRLDQLDEPAQAVTRVLGVADRPLSSRIVAAATGLEDHALLHGLRLLSRAHLLSESDAAGEVQLRHPLLAEAVRRRLVGHEAASVHRRLAEVLCSEPDAAAAEVAEHWRGAGDDGEELVWRIAAARAAQAQWASSQAAEQWLRALEVWPVPRADVGDPPVSRPEAYLAAIDALKDSLQFDRAAAMSADASRHFPDLEPSLRAEFLRRAAIFRTEVEGPEVGLELIDEAIRLLSGQPTGVGMVRAMARRHQLLIRSGRYAEAVDVARQGVVAAEAVGDLYIQRLLLGHVAWHEAVVDGAWARALESMAQARSLPAVDDPSGAIFLSVIWTDALLVTGAGADEVVAAGRDALALAEDQGIEDFGPLLVRYNMVKALVDDGRQAEAEALLATGVGEDVDLDRAPIVIARTLLDVLAGHLGEAAHTTDVLCRDIPSPIQDLDLATVTAAVAIWNDRPGQGWTRVQPAIDAHAGSAPPAMLLPPLVVGARAVADLAARGGEVHALRAELLDLHQRGVGRRPAPAFRSRAALDATFAAELARLDGSDPPRVWQAAGSAWSDLGRPYDAAYCRWRGAQAALRDGHGTAAVRLLNRAVVDARGHQPLLAAIEATRSGREGTNHSS